MTLDQPTSNTAGPFKLRLRGDLEFYPQRCRARKVWVVKDPLALRYFQFREEEFTILGWLDGRSTLPQIKDRFERRFAPQRMTVARLYTFVANLHRNSLVISDSAGQGEQLLARATHRRRRDWIAALSNPLAIRFRGLDPRRLIDWLYPRVRWLFSRGPIVVCLGIAVAALLLVVVQWDQLMTRLPELNAFLHPRNLVWLAVGLALTKVLHELGHALTCRHFGGQCHEMGLMLLVFTPCLYCNVTDAWKLSDRWQRVAITAAGIGVEMVLASVCVWLWWFTQPGFFNTLCLNIVVICSVGTVLLNGNPLLRYDGYYILSDVLETPNLWQDSRASVSRRISKWFWGFDPGNPVSLRNRSGMLLVYACLSMVYRVTVVASLLYLVYRVLQPLGLVLLAQCLGMIVVAGIVSVPARSVWHTLSSPVQRRQVRPKRVIASTVTLTVFLLGFFLIPLPCRLTAPATVQPRAAKRVYVSVPGKLLRTAAAGDRVRSGDLLAELQNTEIERELREVEGQCVQQRMRLRSLESLRGRNNDLGNQLPAAKAILGDLEKRRKQLQRDLASLSLIAPASGTVLAPPGVGGNRGGDEWNSELELRSWHGTPLEKRNLGCHLERQTLFCLIGQPNDFEAVLYIDQSDIRYVEVGQRVRLHLEIAPGHILEGTVTNISKEKVELVPTELAVDQEVSSRLDRRSLARPEETSYEAHVRIETEDVPLLVGATGRAKISVQSQPLSQRFYRFLARTFKPVL